jgi:hypothetical protein
LSDEQDPADEELTEVPAFEPAPTDALEIAAEEDAAAEAGAIGGVSGEEGLPEAQRPLAEAGEGESEGFEQAEEALIEAATHGDSSADPLADRFTPEDAASEGLSAHGEADHVDIGDDDDDESDKE